MKEPFHETVLQIRVGVLFLVWLTFANIILIEWAVGSIVPLYQFVVSILLGVILVPDAWRLHRLRRQRRGVA